MLIVCLFLGTSQVFSAETETSADEYEVVVIGGGLAGLCAAVSAAEEGAEVVLLEKLGFLGGNSLLSTGALYLGATSMQKEKGIDDSADSFYNDAMADSDNRRDPVQTRLVADFGGKVLDWLIANGVEFADEVTAVIGGSPTPRAHRSLPNASGLITALQAKAEELGVTILMETSATELIEEDNKIVGIMAKTKDGEDIHLLTDHVIVAVGGYGADYDRLVRLTPAAEGLLHSGASGTTGEIVEQMIDLGAATIDLEEPWLTPTIETERKLLLTSLILSGGAILVDDEGNRYTNETKAYADISIDSLALGIDHQVEIFDSQVRDHVYKVPEYIEMGMVHEVGTIEELAEATGLPVFNLQATIDDYNAVVRGEKEDDFGRALLPVELNQPPYYYATVSPGTIMTPGGVAINENCQVLHTNGQIIEGLYATGESTGGYRVFGYRGGDSLAHAAVTGYIAGKAATTAGGESKFAYKTQSNGYYVVEGKVTFAGDEIIDAEIDELNTMIFWGNVTHSKVSEDELAELGEDNLLTGTAQLHGDPYEATFAKYVQVGDVIYTATLKDDGFVTYATDEFDDVVAYLDSDQQNIADYMEQMRQGNYWFLKKTDDGFEKMDIARFTHDANLTAELPKKQSQSKRYCVHWDQWMPNIEAVENVFLEYGYLEGDFVQTEEGPWGVADAVSPATIVEFPSYLGILYEAYGK